MELNGIIDAKQLAIPGTTGLLEVAGSPDSFSWSCHFK